MGFVRQVAALLPPVFDDDLLKGGDDGFLEEKAGEVDWHTLETEGFSSLFGVGAEGNFVVGEDVAGGFEEGLAEFGIVDGGEP